MGAAFQPGVSGWRTLISISLLAGYVALASQGIHCQYFTSEHAHHQSADSASPDHAVHCILANHGSAALPSIDSQSAPAPSVFGLLQLSSTGLGVTTLVASKPARAPPQV
jgi:hypothetical protein